MDTDVEVLARCHLLALAALRRAADVADVAAGPGLVRPQRLDGHQTDVEMLAAFSPAARARILAVLDRLPPGKLVVASRLPG